MNPGGEGRLNSLALVTLSSTSHHSGIAVGPPAANSSPTPNGTRSHWCLMELNERMPIYLDGTGAHAYPPLEGTASR